MWGYGGGREGKGEACSIIVTTVKGEREREAARGENGSKRERESVCVCE